MNIQTKAAAADKLRTELAQYYGSEQLYRHGLNRSVLYTDGVHRFAENAGGGAYWFLDILATEPAILREAREFAHVTLHVKEDETADLVVTDGGKDGAAPATVYTRHLNYTDCPCGKWEFYFENNTIMLPAER